MEISPKSLAQRHLRSSRRVSTWVDASVSTRTLGSAPGTRASLPLAPQIIAITSSEAPLQRAGVYSKAVRIRFMICGFESSFWSRCAKDAYIESVKEYAASR